MSEPKGKTINRRDFLQAVSKAALPTIAVVGLGRAGRLAAGPRDGRRPEQAQDCGQTCVGSCRRVCADTCQADCTGGCKNECAKACNDNCSGKCKNDCALTCNNNCEGFCKGQNQY